MNDSKRPGLNLLVHKNGYKNSMFFLRSSTDQNYMQGSISIQNISFSRNCDIKTKKVNCSYFDKAY